MYERMFLDEDKDVLFKLADGEERAHKVVLKAASEVFSGMFKHGMRENAEGVVELPDVSRAAMRVFLRLIYTGHVDPSDWGQAEKVETSSAKVLRQANMTANLPQLCAQCNGWLSSALLEASLGNFEFAVRSTNWQGHF